MLYPNSIKNEAYYPILDDVKVVGDLITFMDDINKCGLRTDSIKAISSISNFHGRDEPYLELEEKLQNHYGESIDVYVIMFRCYHKLKTYTVGKHDNETIKKIKEFAKLCTQS